MTQITGCEASLVYGTTQGDLALLAKPAAAAARPRSSSHSMTCRPTRLGVALRRSPRGHQLRSEPAAPQRLAARLQAAGGSIPLSFGSEMIETAVHSLVVSGFRGTLDYGCAQPDIGHLEKHRFPLEVAVETHVSTCARLGW